MQIIILGMHRSGTSTVSRLANMMGAYFAPEGKEMASQSDNPKGFWERTDVMQLNDEILNAAGGSWNQLSGLSLNTISAQEKEIFTQRINAIVLGMDAHRPWSLKDPRMCLTLPIWRPSLEIPVFLFVYRNPVQIAQSLAKRNSIPLSVGIALWEYYMVSALNAARDGDLLFTRYEDIMSDPIKETRRIYQGLKEAGVTGLRMPSKKEITAFINPDLFHHADGYDLFSEYLNNNQLDLIRIMENDVHADDWPNISISKNAHEIINNYCLLTKEQDALSSSQAALTAATAALSEKEKAIADLGAINNESRKQVEVLHQEKSRLQEELSQAQQKLSEAEGLSASLEKAYEQVRGELSSSQAALTAAAAALSEKEKAIADLGAINNESRKKFDGLYQEKLRLQEELSQAQQKLSEAEGLSASLVQEHEQVWEDLTVEHEQVCRLLEESQAALSEKSQAFSEKKLIEDQLEREKESLQDELSHIQKDYKEAVTELIRLNQELSGKDGLIAKYAMISESRQKEIVDFEKRISENGTDHNKILSDVKSLKSVLSDSEQHILAQENAVFIKVQGLESNLIFLLAHERRKYLEKNHRGKFSVFLSMIICFLLHPRRTFAYYHDRKIVVNSSLFDEQYYLTSNTDVMLNYADAVEHFCLYGWKEGRSPHPSFDISYYLSSNPDVAEAKVNPLVHFELHGWKEGRKPSAGFSRRIFNSSPNMKKTFSQSQKRQSDNKEKSPHPKSGSDDDREGHALNVISPLPPLKLARDGEKGIPIPVKNEKPIVSIIVSAFNHWDVTANCLASIVNHTDSEETPYEIILADDCSTDETKDAANIFPGLKTIRTEKNQGYLLNTNNAASHATGEYIVLLNNDTLVQDRWLIELLETFRLHPKAGIVGSLLCDQNGVTMDSGNLIKSDGTGDCWGRGFPPDHPSFSYVRRCHYVTAASLMIKKDLWDEIGGFDARYAPSYCEDADLGIEVRKRGYEVLIQPFSRVVHLENVSQGSSAREQIKVRTEILKQKWADELKKYPDSMGNAFMDKDLSPLRQTIVVVEGWVPVWDTNAGARCFLMFIQLKRKMGYNVKLIFHYDYPEQYKEYITKYQRMGFEVWHSSISNIGWKEWLFTRRYGIDAVFIHRPNVAEITQEWVKNVLQKPVIYFNHDLHFLRMQRENSLGDCYHSDENIEIMKRKEINFIKTAEIALSPSLYEVEYCSRHFKVKNCFFMPLFIYDNPINPSEKIFDQKTIIFVAGFNHKPNVQGGLWFMENVWMRVKAACPAAELHIVGSDPPAEMMDYHQKNGVTVHGYVTDEALGLLYAKAHMSIIPLLSGAGLKGKLLEAMFHGVPVVGTTVAFEGCPDIQKMAKPVDSPDEFARDVIELLKKPDECLKRRQAGHEIIRNHFSYDAGIRTMSKYIAHALRNCPPHDEKTRREKLESDKKLILSLDQFDADHYASKNPKVFYTGMRPEDFYFFYEKHNVPSKETSVSLLQKRRKAESITFLKKQALVISPVSTEFGQGNSILTKNLTQKIADMGYEIHFIYYPSDNSEFLNNQKTMPWDHVYTVEDRQGVLLKLKYDKKGNPLPDAHLIDDWCGPELIDKVKELSAKIKFDLCLCNYVWLSKTLECLPAHTLKLIETHDKFSHRDSDERVLAGKKHSGWFSTVPQEEKKGLSRADYVLAVQEEDAQFFASLIGAKKVFVVAAALPERYMDIKPFKGKMVMGYIAGVNGFNNDQIKRFYDAWEKRPELTKKTELYIAGSIGKWLNANHPLPKARVQGFIDNIADFYAQCDVIINPDFGGTGIKIKCIEALSYGKPLICSERSMNGISSDNAFHKAKHLEELLDMLYGLALKPDGIQRQAGVSKEIYRRYIGENDFSSILIKNFIITENNNKKFENSLTMSRKIGATTYGIH
jgi:GT2 family glycosyltransferase